jgi:hypothetical protein
MRIWIVSLILTGASFSYAQSRDDKPGKEAYDSWSNQFVSTYNSALTLKELFKRLQIMDAKEIELYGKDELLMKLPRVSYNAPKSEFRFANGQTVVATDPMARKFKIDGKDYVLPDELPKYFADKLPVKSEATGCEPREKAGAYHHAGLLPFPMPAAYLTGNFTDWSGTPDCENQVKTLTAALKSGRVELISLNCQPKNRRMDFDVKLGSQAALVRYNVWTAAWDVITPKETLTFLPTQRMRMGAKLCAPDFDKYKVMRKFVTPLEPVVKEILSNNFCGKCGRAEWTGKLTSEN